MNNREQSQELPENKGNFSFHSGFFCLIGRPNVGKSTLMNALINDQIAITSAKPQTTRHVIRGIIHRSDGQIVVVDTPGIHKPRTLLGKHLNDLAQETYLGVDCIGLCFPADEKIGPGDRRIIDDVMENARNKKLIGIVTKSDKTTPELIAQQLILVSELLPTADIIAVSAHREKTVTALIDLIIGLLPEGPAYYPEGHITDETDEMLIAECIRGAAIEKIDDELPHSVAVTIEEIERKDKDHGTILVIYANICIERDSQKGIILGHKGKMLTSIGKQARLRIESIFDAKVFLHLHVKVVKDWQRDPKQLGKLGF